MKKGFTLMEVLTVVIIVGILTSIAIPRYNKIMERARFTKAEVMAKSLYESCERLLASYGVEEYASLPASAKVFSALDIGSTELLPSGFLKATALGDETDWFISGAGFSYWLLADPSCGVKISRTKSGTNVIITYNGTNMTCTGNEDLCDIYGVEYEQ